MPRQTREQIDAEILDVAAGVFARYGFEHTSVQAIADAVGYSKAGLLHRFPSKEAIRDGVVTLTASWVQQLASEAEALPISPERDRFIIERMVALCADHPGVISLALSPHKINATDANGEDQIVRDIFDAFGVGEDISDERYTRVGVALAGIAAVTNGAHQAGELDIVRPHIITASYDALGHSRRSAQKAEK